METSVSIWPETTPEVVFRRRSHVVHGEGGPARKNRIAAPIEAERAKSDETPAREARGFQMPAKFRRPDQFVRIVRPVRRGAKQPLVESNHNPPRQRRAVDRIE